MSHEHFDNAVCYIDERTLSKGEGALFQYEVDYDPLNPLHTILTSPVEDVAWSEDGETWHVAEEKEQRVPMRFDIGKFFMGAKFAVFNYATKAAGGYVDVDKFLVNAEEHELPVARFRRFTLDGVMDDFEKPFLADGWRELGPTNCVWWRSAISKGRGLAIQARPFAVNEPGTVPSLLLKKPSGADFSASVAIQFSPRQREDFAGLSVYGGPSANYVIGKTMSMDGRFAVQLVRNDKKGKSVVASAPLKKDAPIFLRAERKGSTLRFAFSVDGKKWTALGGAEGAYDFPSDVSVGVYATSNALR